MYKSRKNSCGWICVNKAFYEAFFKNPKFFKKYIESLREYSKEEFINKLSAEYDKNCLHFDQYFNSRLYPNDAIFYRGLNVYLFKFGEIHKRQALIEKKLLKLDEFLKYKVTPINTKR